MKRAIRVGNNGCEAIGNDMPFSLDKALRDGATVLNTVAAKDFILVFLDDDTGRDLMFETADKQTSLPVDNERQPDSA
jgi:hypothetical protein